MTSLTSHARKTVSLLLHTTGVSIGGESLTGGLECAVLELTEPLLKKIRARGEQIIAVHRQDPSVYEMYYWDTQPLFFEDDLILACEERYGESWLTRYEGRGFAPLPPEFGTRLAAGEFEPRRTECDQMAVSCAPDSERRLDVSVKWSVIPKHGGIYVETTPIQLAELERLMASEAE